MIQNVQHFRFRLYADGFAQNVGQIPLLTSVPVIVPEAPSGVAGTLAAFPPEHPVVQKWTWRVDALKSWDGDEHRISLMGAPREQYEMNVLIEDADLRQVRADLFGNGGPGVHLMPRWEEGILVTVTPTGAVLTTETTAYADWMVAAQRCLVVGPGGVSYQGVIQSFDVNAITLDVSPPAGNFLGGRTRVYPLVTAYFEALSPVSRWNVNLGRWALSMRLAEFGTSFGRGSPAFVVFDGFTVLADLQVGEQDEERMDHQEEFFDFGAAFTRKHAQTLADINRTVTFRIENAPARQYWKKFITDMRGRQSTFRLPTWRPDLVLNAQPTTQFVTIVTSAVNYQTVWFPSLAHKHLQFRMVSGSNLYRKVIAVVDNGNGTQTLELDAAVDTGALGNVDFISFLELCHLSSDDVTFSWDIAQGHVTFPVTVVQG
jgi:hypothetical protein